jgi:hypothetical protein
MRAIARREGSTPKAETHLRGSVNENPTAKPARFCA